MQYTSCVTNYIVIAHINIWLKREWSWRPIGSWQHINLNCKRAPVAPSRQRTENRTTREHGYGVLVSTFDLIAARPRFTYVERFPSLSILGFYSTRDFRQFRRALRRPLPPFIFNLFFLRMQRMDTMVLAPLLDTNTLSLIGLEAISILEEESPSVLDVAYDTRTWSPIFELIKISLALIQSPVRQIQFAFAHKLYWQNSRRQEIIYKSFYIAKRNINDASDDFRIWISNAITINTKSNTINFELPPTSSWWSKWCAK